MAIPEDLKRWIAKNFMANLHTLAEEKLEKAVDHSGHLVNPRLQRCAAMASRGDMEKLDYYLHQLTIDYRDVIVAGEYDVENKKLIRRRNLANPICDSVPD